MVAYPCFKNTLSDCPPPTWNGHTLDELTGLARVWHDAESGEVILIEAPISDQEHRGGSINPGPVCRNGYQSMPAQFELVTLWG